MALDQQKQQTAHLGMMIALGSWTMLFATVLFGYVVLRLQATHWYSFGVTERPFIQASVNTVVIILSSVFYINAAKAVGSEHPGRVRQNLWLALACGCGFTVMQWCLWQSLVHEGIRLSTSISASAIYAMTGLHVIHVLGGLAAILWLVIRSHKRTITIEEKTPLVLVGWFWHFLTIIWCVFFTAIFVIH